tara:strand:+ start:304 stop:429 length:126 start_codon:yes stop_codon:yes gene_type:complete
MGTTRTRIKRTERRRTERRRRRRRRHPLHHVGAVDDHPVSI